MNSQAYIRSRSGSRDGIALVIVLAFIVLLTILIVSFIAFTRLNRGATASYSKGIQAQEIAQGGLEDILGDLHQEIVAGSTVLTNASGSYVVYVPTTNFTAQPARIGYPTTSYGSDSSPTTLSPTLIRVSRATGNGGDTFFTATPSYYSNMSNVSGGTILNRASAASTANSYNGGRSISAARWNKSYLLATNSANIPSPFTATPPDWIYVTRTGSRTCNVTTDTMAKLIPSSSLATSYGTITPGSVPPASPVVGRYAFVMYDEGALLDINVAGYISGAGNSTLGFSTNVISTPSTNNPAGIAQNISSKSYLAYADLTQLPGLSGAQTSVIDPLIKWRNATVTMSTASTAATNYFQMVFNNAKNGFLTFQSNSTTSDSPLLGRQDLINYFGNLDKAGSTSYSTALPYLGTFSRAANAPSWNPTADSQNMTNYYGGSSTDGTNTYSFVNVASVGYKSNAESNSSINRDIPNVRFSGPATVTHYNDDGTSYTYSALAGDALMQHRFSLARLAWFNNVDPTSGPTANAAAIQACFGLKWGSVSETFEPSGTAVSYPCWQYVGSTGSSVQSSIETLAQVASENREPNFFELLKAGILTGSLGQTPGPGNSSSSDYEGVQTLNLDTYGAQKDKHILQIGANIIDQADSDSYPTAIYLKMYPASGFLAEDDLCVNMVYGVENLPYITRLCTDMVVDPCNSSVTPAIPYIKFWTQPEIWNPSQPPSTGTGLANRPTNFRLHAYGKIHYVFTSSSATVPTTPLASIDYDDNSTQITYHGPGNAATTGTTTGFTSSLIYFTDAATAASPFYNKPIRLSTGLNTTTAGTQTLNIFQPPYYVGLPDDPGSGANPNTFVGFFSGEGQLPDCTTGGGPSGTAPRSGFIDYHASVDRPVYYSIEYQDPSNANFWHPYGFISRIDPGNSVLGQTKSIRGVNYGNTNPNAANIGGTDQSNGGWLISHADPRTDRMGSSESQCTRWKEDTSVDPGLIAGVNAPCGSENFFPRRSYGFVYAPGLPAPCPWFQNQYSGNWVQNLTTANGSGENGFYVDPDGVVRPGDSYRRGVSGAHIMYTGTDTGDGSPAYDGDLGSGGTLPTVSHGSYTAPTGSADARRSVILNRLFRSVGELGYASRDLPYKTLDFSSSSSADTALLDLFSVTDEPTVAAGEVNPSNMPAPALAAILAGSTKMEFNTPPQALNFVTTDATAIASSLATGLLAQPLGSRGDLVKMLDPVIKTRLTLTANYANKAYAEAPLRALSNVTNTRTWNLLIDIIAQSGQMSPTAATLNDFVVQGERRYWLHVAIDRYTGKIIDQQLESVYE